MYDEPLLEDDYPVYPGYYYLVDGFTVESSVRGTVRDLKADVRVYFGFEPKEVRRCDLVKRLRNGEMNFPKAAPKEEPKHLKRPVKSRDTWFVVVDLPSRQDECNRRVEVHSSSHKKAKAVFERSVQAVKDGKSPELNCLEVHEAAGYGYRITKVYSV